MVDHRSELIGHVTAPEYDYLYMLRRHYCTVGPGAFIRHKAFDLMVVCIMWQAWYVATPRLLSSGGIIGGHWPMRPPAF